MKSRPYFCHSVIIKTHRAKEQKNSSEFFIIFFQSIQYSAYPASRFVYKEIYKNSILYGKGVSEIEIISLYNEHRFGPSAKGDS